MVLHVTVTVSSGFYLNTSEIFNLNEMTPFQYQIKGFDPHKPPFEQFFQMDKPKASNLAF